MQGPVEFTYYLDLKEKWDFRWKDVKDGITVIAPRLRYNMPAVDVSNLSITVSKGSILRDEQATKEKLRAEITRMTRVKAQKKISFARETARQATREFVNEWFIALKFDEMETKPFIREVYFADEQLPETLPDQPQDEGDNL